MGALETSHRRSERIDLRVKPEFNSLLRTAAEMEHKSLSAFMLDAAIERARVAVEANRRFAVSASEFSRVLDELDRPAEVVEPLLKLAERVALRKKTAAR